MGSRRGAVRGKRAKRSDRSLAATLAVLALALAVFVVAAAGSYVLIPRRGRGRVVRVTFPAQPTADSVTGALARAGVIDHPWAFGAIVRVTGAAEKVRTGTFAFRDDLAPRAVLKALFAGGGLVRVTIPEGLTRFDVARRMGEVGLCEPEEFLAVTENPAVLARHGIHARAAGDVAPTLEGYLYPDTYDIPLGETAEEIVERMLRVFEQRFRALKAAHPAQGLRAAELAGSDGADAWILTLASLVERETGAPEDRRHVASVFWNRLTRADFSPRLLQSDPTVVYGCLALARAQRGGTACGDADAGARMNISAAMLQDARNPWNTYRFEGLPPTPVCSPGAHAIEAALDPTEDADLYFVARGDGRSVFAPTLAEHRRNVQTWLRR